MAFLHKLLLATLVLAQCASSFVLRSIEGIKLAPLIAPSNDILAALKDAEATIVDLRNPGRVSQTGLLRTQAANGEPHSRVNIPVTPFDTSPLECKAPKAIPSKTKPVLVYCASGRRTGVAIKALEDMGYKAVLNMGGWQDAQAYKS